MVFELLRLIQYILRLLFWDLLIYPFILDLLYGGLDGGFNWGLTSRCIIFVFIFLSFYVALYRTTHLSKDERRTVRVKKKDD
ncbi:MAG: hypothetical protein IKD20_02520 [Clostridia bacterium]|nr:hypothetical protein [Clostridia bacterium]